MEAKQLARITLLTLAAICLIQDASGALTCPGLSGPYYNRYPGRYLVDGLLLYMTSPSSSVCATLCTNLMKDCRSFNYNKRTGDCYLLANTQASPGSTLRVDTNGYDHFEASCSPAQITATPTPQPTAVPTPTPLPPVGPVAPGADGLPELPVIFLAVGAIIFAVSLIIVIVHWSLLSQWWSAVNKLD